MKGPLLAIYSEKNARSRMSCTMRRIRFVVVETNLSLCVSLHVSPFLAGSCVAK